MALSKRAELVALYPPSTRSPSSPAGRRFARSPARAADGQPLHQHGKIAPVGAERILGQIFFQPQRVEKLFNECEILFHISPFDSAVRPLCLIVTGFWYTTRKVKA